MPVFMNPFALRWTQFPSQTETTFTRQSPLCWIIGQPLTCAWRWLHQVTAEGRDGAKAECSFQDLRLAQMDTFRVLSASDMGTKLKRHRFHSPQSRGRGGGMKVFDLRHGIECMAGRAFQTPFYFLSCLFMEKRNLLWSLKPVPVGALKSFKWLHEKLISHLVWMRLTLFRISIQTHPWRHSEKAFSMSSLMWSILLSAAWLEPLWNGRSSIWDVDFFVPAIYLWMRLKNCNKKSSFTAQHFDFFQYYVHPWSHPHKPVDSRAMLGWGLDFSFSFCISAKPKLTNYLVSASCLLSC